MPPAVCARSARGAGSSWSSTPAGRRPPKRPTSTFSSGPAPMPTSCSRWRTRCWPRVWSTSAVSSSTSTGSTRWGAWSRTSIPRPSRPCAASTPTRSVAPAASSRRPPAPRSMHASARARRSSARSRRGSSMCSTCSRGTSTAKAAPCSRCPRRHPGAARAARAAACASVAGTVACGVCPRSTVSPPSLLARAHYDVAFYQLSIRNIANYSPPAVELEPGDMDEWEILLRLANIVAGQGASADPHALDDFVLAGLVDKAVQREGSVVAGRRPEELLEALSSYRGPERLLELMLRTGPYGDGFGAKPDGLSLAKLEANPHGVDLGPLKSRIPEVLRTLSGKVERAPDPIGDDVARLRGSLDHRRNGGMVLVGRRDLRSNNSWMHNLDVLVKGKERCTMHVHPDDARRLGLADGQPARVTSKAGTITVPVEVTDTVMPGVASIPHGWGHDLDDIELGVAAGRPGVNTNVLTDSTALDPLSGNCVLNGIPIEVGAG